MNARAAQDIPALSARLQRDSTDHQARTRLGVAYLQAGKPAEARPLLEAAVAERPGDANAKLHLGFTYEALALYRDARRLYEEYIATTRSSTLRSDLKRRLALLNRRELEAFAKQAVARETELRNTPPRDRTVAVFPFQVLQEDTALRPLGRALAELLVVDLSQTSRLTVLERLQVQLLLDELKLSASNLVDPGQALRGGRLLGAEQIVQGSLAGEAESLELNAAIVNVRETTRAAANPAARVLSERDAMSRVLAAQKRLALRLYESLGVELTVAERERVNRRPTENLRAILAFGTGLEAYDRGDYAGAARQFADAARLDPAFAMARNMATQARENAAAVSVSTTQLIEMAAIESSQPGAPATDVLTPDPFARDAAAEVLGNEGLGRKTIIELIFRRPNR
ncbi:MAG: tetratricopeptide repeat protein [Longimicrobiales bacterium]